jgi:hypothetical protein
MSEVTFAFRRVERPNVRANTSVQPLKYALRSFAQECLQRMKQHLYWVRSGCNGERRSGTAHCDFPGFAACQALKVGPVNPCKWGRGMQESANSAQARKTCRNNRGRTGTEQEIAAPDIAITTASER